MGSKVGGMRVETTINDGVAFLVVTGEVDLATADVLREAGVAALTPFVGTVRIDLAGVTFIDSTGLAALMTINNKAEHTHTIILENPSRKVRRILALTGLDRVFVIEPVLGLSA
jgi:anti-sigma B factor antagonist